MSLLNRLRRFLPEPAADTAAAGLYRTCVAQAREPGFYKSLGVPDTVDGRFDLLLLHVILAMRRLGSAGETSQKLFDLMFADMDLNLREMGVGDMSVGKKIKPMLAAFYGRARAYEKALAESDTALEAALQRNLFGAATAPPEAARRLADYVRRSIETLEQQPLDGLISGRIEFPALFLDGETL